MVITEKAIKKARAEGYKLTPYEQWQYDAKKSIAPEKTGINNFIQQQIKKDASSKDQRD